MKTVRLLFFLIIAFIAPLYANERFTSFLEASQLDRLTPTVNSEWTVIGSGPAGIAIVGLLLDAGVDPSGIIWIDPEFNIGRMGKYYSNVPANSLIKNLLAYINACKTFSSCPSQAVQNLKLCDPSSPSLLALIVETLREITTHLRTKILSLEDTVVALNFHGESWQVQTTKSFFTSNHVVLATGSHPRTLPYKTEVEIPLDLALDKEKLSHLVNKTDTIGVVGDRHSAFLILRYLHELSIDRILHFYRNNPTYSNSPGTDNIGLVGSAAEWAREIYEKNPPHNLFKIFSCEETLKTWTTICTKIIYALGFEPNALPLINGKISTCYYDTNGVLMPRLFGIGIAFPEQYVTVNGNITHRVGILQFMEYAQKVMPLWMQKKSSTHHFAEFEDLLSISYIYMSQ
jgi:hypothetical protein